MSTQNQAALLQQLDAYKNALLSTDTLTTVSQYFLPHADARAGSSLVRGWDAIAGTSSDILKLRAQADVVTIRFLSDFPGSVALVDHVGDSAQGRGWFTEVWDNSTQDTFGISAFRARVGGVSTSYKSLSANSVTTLRDQTVPASVQAREEGELRKRFKAFRNAFNSADVASLGALYSTSSDAIVAFSFLQGRAQILNGRAAMVAKAERMTTTINPPTTALAAVGGASASAPASGSTAALFVSGEPKVIRFVSATLAVVDGTAEIAGIPPAHGFTPSEMQGVYTDIWSKSQGEWLIEGARPWF